MGSEGVGQTVCIYVCAAEELVLARGLSPTCSTTYTTVPGYESPVVSLLSSYVDSLYLPDYMTCLKSSSH